MAKQHYMTKLLFNAVLDGDYGTSEDLLVRGANPNLMLTEGATPFHVAVGLEDMELAQKFTQLLLDFGGNPNVRCSEGATPLHVAACFGYCDTLRILLQHGGDPALQDKDSVDGLQCAQSSGCALCVLLVRQAMEGRQASPDFSSSITRSVDVPKPQRVALLKTPHSTSTTKLQHQLNVLDPKTQYLDVTSPDHPLLLEREQSDLTVVMADSGGHDSTLCASPEDNPKGDTDVDKKEPGIKSDTSSASTDSFHSCQSQPETLKGAHSVPQITVSSPSNCMAPKVPSVSRCEHTSNIAKCSMSRSLSTPPQSRMYHGASLMTSDESDTSDITSSNRYDVCHHDDQRSRQEKSNRDAEVTSVASRLSELCVSEIRTGFTDVNSEPKTKKSEEHDQLPSLLQRKESNLMELSILDGPKTSSRNTSMQVPPKDQRSESESTSQCSLGSYYEGGLNFLYTDDEDGLSLIETFYPVANSDLDLTLLSQGSDSTLTDWKAFQQHSQELLVSSDDTITITPSISDLDNTALRRKLEELGDCPGPITSSTRRLYEARLVKLQQGLVQPCTSAPSEPNLLPEIKQAVSGELDVSLLQQLEAKLTDAFEDRSHQTKWREGTLKTSFNYLLLDPRVTKNLPARARYIREAEGLETFIKSIFYIGKGKRGRPYAHFKEAIIRLQNPAAKTSDKVQHILDIWAEGLGVVSVHCFQNLIPAEAYTREGAMIEALGLAQLTNAKRGEFYGPTTSWSLKQKREFGAHLLRKAYQLFVLEGERQIRPADIDTRQ